MSKYETVIFPIVNLRDLSGSYILFEIEGLRNADDDFDLNIQYIIRSLSFRLKHPITVVSRAEKPFLVVRAEADILEKLPSEYPTKRGEIVYFTRRSEPFKIDFLRYDAVTREIILRFLQFDVQTELYNNLALWQPGSGDAFFSTTPAEYCGNIAIYTGFYVRVVEFPEKGFGLAVDITKKYVSKFPLKPVLSKAEFDSQRIAFSHLVYMYGDTRYEIRADEISDLDVCRYKFTRASDKAPISLLEDAREKFGSSMPPELAMLPDNASVLVYRTNDNQERAAIAGLCYKVFDTEDEAVKKLHHKSIIDPFHRRRLIRYAHNNYLKKLGFGRLQLNVSPEPVMVEKKVFRAPDVVFGNNAVLSVRNTPGAQGVTIENLGKVRKHLLSAKDAGFHSIAAFEPQYFIMPQTVFNMYGNDRYFLKDLKAMVNAMHQTESGWHPLVITYDNRRKQDVTEIGYQILQRMQEQIKKKAGGYAVVMLPAGLEKMPRQHDELAALVVSECLEEYGITASIMHSDMLEECYTYQSVNGQPAYNIRSEKHGKYAGYVRGVAINQVLLNNERWPYILGTPMYADLTIGIDVKRYIAGFTFVDKANGSITTKLDKSGNKEKLSKSQIMQMFIKYITIIYKHDRSPRSQIVIHRDGRIFATEKSGIYEAIAILKDRGILPANVSVNIVEIPKTSVVPFRLFEVRKPYPIFQQAADNGQVLNPQIGSWVKMSDREAFLCTTGREFAHQGSSKPLHIKYESGAMPIEEIVEDVYYLSCLAYTKPEDCSRYPITIKITDTRINIAGSAYDMEALDIMKATN